MTLVNTGLNPAQEDDSIVTEVLQTPTSIIHATSTLQKTIVGES